MLDKVFFERVDMKAEFDPNARSLIKLNNKSKSQYWFLDGKKGRVYTQSKSVQTSKQGKNDNPKAGVKVAGTMVIT